MNSRKIASLFLTILGPCVLPAFAQQVAPAGVVTVAAHATLGNTAVSVGSTVFSGDLLKTDDQGHLNIQLGTAQFAVGPNSSVRLFHSLNRTVVELERGTLAYTAKGVSEDLTLFALDVRLVPKTAALAAGQITVVSRCDVSVTAFHGSIDVTSGRETKTVEETKSYRVLSDFGVDYRDSWQPTLAEYPDYPKEAPYHHSHAHVACPAGVWQTAKSPLPGLRSHFAEVVGGVAAIATWFGLDEVFESPDRP